MRRFIFLVFILCIIKKEGNSQSAPYTRVNIASPTAASLGKFGDIPVSHHTGIPNISIPIYTVNEGTLSMPISLSYHAGGIKVMEPAGWVGTGWGLNSGGVISRTLRGAADERNTSNGLKGHFSDYGFSNYLTFLGGSSCDGAIIENNDNWFANGQLDGEPDLFSFNFNGYSGKFYFNDDRTPVIVDGQDIKVNYYYTQDTATTYSGDASPNIQGFTLTVSNGDKYYFGINPGAIAGGVSPVEITFPFSNDNENITDRIISSWYLTKIISADGMFTIALTYQAENYSYYTLSMFPVDASLSIPPDEYKLVKMFVDGVRLDHVVFSNGSVSFTPSSALRTDLGDGMYSTNTIGLETDNANTEAKSLAGISISNNNGFCKKFNFYYSYFFDNSSTPLSGSLSYSYPSIQTDKYRLKLDSLKEQSCDNSIINPPYKFNYYSNFLPRRLSFSQDHWGFYNGAVNSTLIPTYTIDTFQIINGANRDPKWPEMQCGALTQIIYPTGGFNAFDFEPNTTWINTTRYTPGAHNSYSVGYDGNNSRSTPNVPFSGNHYEVVISNPPCPPGQSGCTATVQVLGPGNVFYAGITAPENQSASAIIVVPPGNYTVAMYRSAVQTGTGAQATFTETIPSLYQANATVGGLRIKTLTKNDGISFQNNILTSYNYDLNGQSSGILYSRPSYVQILRSDIVAKFGWTPACSSETLNVSPNGCSGPETFPNSHKYFKSPCPIVPMANTQGNHIGYNRVTVSQSGNGSSIYQYYGSNAWDNVISDIANRNVNPEACILSIPNMPANPVAFEYKRGELYYESHLNQTGGRLKEIYYYYDFDSTKLSTPAWNVKFVMGALLGSTYELRGYWKTKVQTLTNDYGVGGTINSNTNTTYFESAFHHQPTRQETNNSLGEIISSKSKYASDFRISSCDAISDCSSAYYSACTSCDVTMNTATFNCTTLACKYRAYTINMQCRANARVNYSNCRKTNFTNPTNTFGTCLINAKLNADALLKPILELQNEFKNPVIENSLWKNNLLTGASFNTFNFFNNPAGRSYPSKTKLINLQASSGTFTSAVTSANSQSVTSDSRYDDETILKFNNGNIIELTPKTGLPTSYLWSHLNTMPIAKTENALSTETAYTSFENGATEGNWTLPDATMNATYSFTGAKSYSLVTGKTISAVTPAGKQYYVTYWSRNGSITIKANNVSIASTFTGPPKNGWTYYEHLLPSTTTSVLLTATSAVIDEVRLYPSGAHLTSYTYLPLVGITSRCDALNSVSYYQYDALGRVINIKDQDGNILKTYQYHYKNQQAGN